MHDDKLQATYFISAVVSEKGGEADCPEAKATVFPCLSFCYHDNIYNLQQLKPVSKRSSSPNNV